MNFAFVVLEEHPYGREMLRQLLDVGLVPGLVRWLGAWSWRRQEAEAAKG